MPNFKTNNALRVFVTYFGNAIYNEGIYLHLCIELLISVGENFSYKGINFILMRNTQENHISGYL